jgi:FkbM family methyltransferase
MKIVYGVVKHVSDICKENELESNIIKISEDENKRNEFFSQSTDKGKSIFIIDDNHIINEYKGNEYIEIDVDNNTVNSVNIQDKIRKIHSPLKINYGNMMEEFSEQKMVVRYLKGNEKVLEIGGNIGRNSLVIASILNHNDFVTLECNKRIVAQLEENRNLNNFHFHIENAALSKGKMIQKEWDSLPSNELLPGYEWINTISIEDLKSKYNIQFDTLVLDCEGAFYYILQDMPEILDNIQLIIMENDYHDFRHYDYISFKLTENGFYRDYVEGGGWGHCYHNFYEVWKRKRV